MLIQQNKFCWISDRSMVAHLNYTDTLHGYREFLTLNAISWLVLKMFTKNCTKHLRLQSADQSYQLLLRTDSLGSNPNANFNPNPNPKSSHNYIWPVVGSADPQIRVLPEAAHNPQYGLQNNHSKNLPFRCHRDQQTASLISLQFSHKIVVTSCTIHSTWTFFYSINC